MCSTKIILLALTECTKLGIYAVAYILYHVRCSLNLTFILNHTLMHYSYVDFLIESSILYLYYVVVIYI